MNSLDEIRELLLGPEQRALSDIRDRLENPARRVQEISRALPQAVIQANAQGANLAEALAPAVEGALKKSVARNPSVITDALFPVIGPAIRRAIADALTKLVVSLNQALDHSLSAQGIRWRFEAWRSGQSYAEVVLARTLIYRVEHLFLVHAQTGLLLQRVSAPGVAARDEDMISGMLSALQDFVRDSFGAEQGDSFRTLEVGDLKIWVERGPEALIAAVVRGHAPRELRSALQGALEEIHREYGPELGRYGGDSSVFLPAQIHLEKCLLAQTAAASGSKPGWKLGFVALLIAMAAGFWGFQRFQDHRRWSRLVERLRQEDGLVLVQAEKQGRRFYLQGLRDPLARDPSAIINESRLPADRVQSRWQPFLALTPGAVLRRAQQRLQPPGGIQMDFEEGRLTVRGEAAEDWAAAAKDHARHIPGVESADFSGIRLTGAAERKPEESFEALLSRLEGFLLTFHNEANLAPGQEESLREVAGLVKSFGEKKPAGWRVAVTGHANRTGNEPMNRALSRQRALHVMQRLVELGAPPGELFVLAHGSTEPLDASVASPEDPRNRRVSFRGHPPGANPPPSSMPP